MNEFVTVSSSSYDPASLAAQLTEKSAAGWTVVAIVPTGGDVTAFLSRAGSAAPAVDAPVVMMAESAPEIAPMPEAAPEPVAEPDGWAVAPAAAPAAAEYTPAPSNAPATVIQSSMSPIGGEQNYNAGNYQAQPTAPAAAAAPAVPAGWYADPAGRFELRYWDGGTWTEHVSRAGQQFTDAPVA